MLLSRNVLLISVAIFAEFASAAEKSGPPMDSLTLIAPSVPGSGWDQLARAMERTVVKTGLVREVQVLNIPGAGGLTGLAEFLSSHRGDSHTLLMGGVTMIRAGRISRSAASLTQTTPIARLTGEYEMIAVPGGPGGADVRSLDDLARAYSVNPKPLTRIPATLGQGIDPSLVNWRGVFASQALGAAQRAALSEIVERMARSPAWRGELDRYHWADLFISGDAFSNFVAAEQLRVAAMPMAASGAPGTPWRTQIWLLRNSGWIAIVVLLALAAVISLMVWQRVTSPPLVASLPQNDPSGDAPLDDLAQRRAELMDRQFDEWGLTVAERDVALLMLKGLRHKEIADLRGTTERTVRQQATMMYKKAGINSRSDLAAFFLFDS
jgi:tripartite-type tricarboxylate transporter receptor subunit TctC/DNA-binding CsgD family transcriptional regulator